MDTTTILGAAAGMLAVAVAVLAYELVRERHARRCMRRLYHSAIKHHMERAS